MKAAEIFKKLQQCLEERKKTALVTVIRAQGSTPRKEGARMLVSQEGLIAGTVGGGRFEYQILQETSSFIDQGGFHRKTFHLTRELAMCCGGEMEVTVEVFSPPRRLLIFGAGHVAQALAPMAANVGFEILIFDDRPEFARADLFPEKTKIYDDFFGNPDCEFEPEDFFLVMTAEHQKDQEILEKLLELEFFGFMGLIGSQTKLAKFKERLKRKGHNEEKINQIKCPVGLDIGAETPEEIAVSISAQLIKKLRLG